MPLTKEKKEEINKEIRQIIHHNLDFFFVGVVEEEPRIENTIVQHLEMLFEKLISRELIDKEEEIRKEPAMIDLYREGVRQTIKFYEFLSKGQDRSKTESFVRELNQLLIAPHPYEERLSKESK